jgi:hypothetical protein
MLNTNKGDTKMTNISFTDKEELVLQVCLDRAWEPNMICFGDIVGDDRLKHFEVDTLKGVYGSLVNKNIMMHDPNNEHDDLYAFMLPVATDDEPENCFDGYVDTVAKVKKWFAEGKNKLHDWS